MSRPIGINPAQIGGGASAMILSFSSGTTKTATSNSPTYEAVARFIYSGTDSVGEVSKFIANVWREGGGGTADIRIQDVTNNNTIAEYIGISTSLESNMQDMGTISNLPASIAAFEIQLKKSGGTTAHVGSVTIEYGF